MKSHISTKLLATAALTLGALAAASAAHARSDVYFSVGIQSPGFYVQPAPMYMQPAPVYMQPAPVYVQPRPVHMPSPGYYERYDNDRRHGGQYYGERRGPYGDRDRDGIANVYDRDDSRHQWRQARLYGPYGDLDRDGIRNQDDRDRDGDGVRNRYDRVPNNPYRR